MSAWRFIFRSLRFHWRINLAVALGVSAATAVLAGALLVGDSVRGSLRFLTLDRLGKIDEVLVSDRFFRSELADELAATGEFKQHYSSATPAILFPQGTVENKTDQEQITRSSDVLIIGCDESFWKLGSEEIRPRTLPGKQQIVLNEPLAEELGIRRADFEAGIEFTVTIRFPDDNQVSADLSIGKKEDRFGSLVDLAVVAIIPAESLGRFSIHPSQRAPRNAYVSVESLQDALQEQGKVNTIFVAGASDGAPPGEQASRALATALNPSFDDYGFLLKRASLTFNEPSAEREEVIFDYFSFTTDRMILSNEAAETAGRTFSDQQAQPVMTYLANVIGRLPQNDQETAALGAAASLEAARAASSNTLAAAALMNPWHPEIRSVPYSTIAAVDFSPQFAPETDDGRSLSEPLADDDIVLNSWTAEDLNVKIGNKIYIKYYEPETSHGETIEKFAAFTLRHIVPITKPSKPFRRNRPREFDQRPTLVNDPNLTPEVPGVTDQQSINDWDLPFELTRPVRPKDDDYYQEHHLTPKAFISLRRGQKLWRSRFGDVTSFRISPAGTTADELKLKFLEQVRRDEAKLGFKFIPIKRNGLAASSGATPFDVLFLFLSFFIIAAALMLVALLFRLGIEQRASEVGTLLAVGLRRKRTGRLLAAEGLLVAAVGGLFGIAIGMAYAWLMVYGLNNWWNDAVVTSFLRFRIGWLSLVIGYMSGVAICVLTILWTIRRARKIAVRRLLAGQASSSAILIRTRRPWINVGVVVLLLGALGLAGYATKLGGESQAGAFVGAGFVMLAALLLFVWYRLRQGGGTSALSGNAALGKLAVRNAGRNPWRSTITIGLVGFASFLIVAMSSFRLTPTENGVAGFDLIARSSRPIFPDLNTPQGRAKLLATDVDGDVMAGGSVLSFRLKPGQDASCNNLFKASQPRVLGVSQNTIDYFDNPNVTKFSFASSAAETDAELANPWRVLAKETPAGEPVPVVIDKNTAMYSLQLYFGIGEEFEVEYDDQTKVRFKVAGLLSNSVLQGTLLIGEADFERLFPQISGYQFFLVRSPPGKQKEVVNALEKRLGDHGFDAQSSKDELAGLLAVQNTYLETFQSLGALGLLLGTLGLATVQLRSVLERRQELALMRAAGFRRGRLATMVMMENSLLLLGGLLTGVIAALLAVLPHMLFGDATIPWSGLAIMLGVILTAGILSGFAAVRWTLRAPLLSALRGE